MLYAHARREARRDASGRYVPLSEQSVERWDQGAIEEAEGLLKAAGAFAAPGRFQLEAAVQSAHAARRLTGTTDWEAIALLYDALLALTASPVVAVNRAAAVAHARGPAAGLKLLDEVGAQGGLAGFEPYWVARADLCAKTGRGRRGAPRLWARDRPADRSSGAGLSHRAAGGAGVRKVRFTR